MSDVQGHWIADLRNVRLRIKLARTVERAARWAFIASVSVGVCLAASKILGWSPPIAWILGPILASAGAAIIIEVLGRFSLSDCAISLDRALGLDERLTTALEATGPMGPAVCRDAAEAWGRAPLRDRRRAARIPWIFPARLLPALGFIALLVGAPHLRSEPTTLPPDLVTATKKEAQRLRATGDPRLMRLAESLANATTPEEIAAVLARLRGRGDEGSGKGSAPEGLASGSGSALSALLLKHGVPLPRLLSTPRELDENLNVVAEGMAGGLRSSRGGEGREGAFEAVPLAVPGPQNDTPRVRGLPRWDPQYDDIVRAYFEVKTQ